jgi:hypothetical protein
MHLKSIWTTAASWFSNSPKKGALASRPFFQILKTAAKRNLGKAVGRGTLAANENRRELSQFRQKPASSGAFFLSAFQRFSISAFQHFSFIKIPPLFPRNPLFPVSGPATNSFNGLHPKSNFLATHAAKNHEPSKSDRKATATSPPRDQYSKKSHIAENPETSLKSVPFWSGSLILRHMKLLEIPFWATRYSFGV